jgi:hypothetical protein
MIRLNDGLDNRNITQFEAAVEGILNPLKAASVLEGGVLRYH